MSGGIIPSTVMAVVVYIIGSVLTLSPLPLMIIQVAAGGVIYLLISVIFKIEAFTYLRKTAMEFLSSFLKKKSA